MKLVNKKAYFDYHVLETWIAGIVLKGTEIKSVRLNDLNFSESFAYINNGEIFVRGIHIALYAQGSYNNHIPDRERKLLLKKKEIKKIENSIDQGITLKLLSIFINERGKCKVLVGLCKGKKNYDKKNTIIEKEMKKMIKNEGL
jgi:SsrA-binding protein